MDLSEKLAAPSAGRARTARHGAALPAAIFGLVVLSVLGAGIFAIGSTQRQATFNRESTVRALLVAEAGIAHGVAVVRDSLRTRGYTRLLRGSDNVANNTDDGQLTGYTLGTNTQVLNAGRATTDGSFTIMMRDDEGDPIADTKTDGNFRIIMRCTGTTTDGASAIVDVVFGATPMPAMAVDGSLSISGNPTLIGECGGAHANVNLTMSGTITSSGTISAVGVATGFAVNQSGSPVTPMSNQEPIEIPALAPNDYCPGADFDLIGSTGYLYRRSDGQSFNANSVARNGFKRSSISPVVWDASGGSIVAGTYCVTGNVVVSGNPGSETSPLALTLLVTGSVAISGNPFIVPALDGISIIATGDVSIAGNPSSSNENYEGSIYAGAQCKISGNPRIDGQVMCKNGAQPAGANEYASLNEVSGNPEISYSCGSMLARRKILEWMQVQN